MEYTLKVGGGAFVFLAIINKSLNVHHWSYEMCQGNNRQRFPLILFFIHSLLYPTLSLSMILFIPFENGLINLYMHNIGCTKYVKAIIAEIFLYFFGHLFALSNIWLVFMNCSSDSDMDTRNSWRPVQ